MSKSDPLLPEMPVVLEGRFAKFGAGTQGILESLSWTELPPKVHQRGFFAPVPLWHNFWAMLWRPNKLAMTKAGFSVGKPGEDWVVTYRFTDDDLLEAARARSAVISTDEQVPVPEGLRLYDYQKAGVAFLRNSANVLLADDMGLGKTAQTIALINATPEIERVLVICPAGVKYVWEREFAHWNTRPELFSAILGVGNREAPVLIVNYDQLRKFHPVLSARPFDLIVLDEAHYCKNLSAQRTKLSRLLAANAKRKVLLTGTPLLNRPAELWPLLNMLDAKAWGKFFPFAQRYCDAYHNSFGWDFTGASNLDELNDRLRTSGIMLRRTKDQVLPQLPRISRQIVPISATGSLDTLEELEERVYALAQGNFRDVEIPFEEMSAIRRETGTLKLPEALKFVLESAEDAPGKIVVFAHHHDVLEALANALGPSSVLVTGKTPQKWRTKYIDQFQNDPAIRFFVGSIHAMGLGVTLTAGTRAIFVEQDWTPAILEQAEARLHRIGQTSNVLSQYLVIRNTIDEKIMSLVISKMEIIEETLKE
jgi:SNF2 family DNA or RNA helicase